MTSKNNLSEQKHTVKNCEHQRTEIVPIKPYGIRANVRCLNCNQTIKQNIPNSFEEVMGDLSRRKANTHFRNESTQLHGTFQNFRFDKARG